MHRCVRGFPGDGHVSTPGSATVLQSVLCRRTGQKALSTTQVITRIWHEGLAHPPVPERPPSDRGAGVVSRTCGQCEAVMLPLPSGNCGIAASTSAWGDYVGLRHSLPLQNICRRADASGGSLFGGGNSTGIEDSVGIHRQSN